MSRPLSVIAWVVALAAFLAPAAVFAQVEHTVSHVVTATADARARDPTRS